MLPLIHKDRRGELLTIKDLIEEDKVRPVLDGTYPFAEIAEAIRFVTEGHALGQVVVTLCHPSTP